MANQTSGGDAAYVNHFQIGYNAFDFVFEFGQIVPNTSETRVRANLVASPSCAKALWRVLADSISRYEAAFGTITPADSSASEGE